MSAGGPQVCDVRRAAKVRRRSPSFRFSFYLPFEILASYKKIDIDTDIDIRSTLPKEATRLRN